MKILITTGIFPPDIGGPATQMERLASDLSKGGFEVSVLTYGTPGKKERPFSLFSVSRRWPVGIRQLMFGIKVFFLSVRADVIYTTDLYSPGFFSMLAGKFWRKKFVVRFAGDSAWETAFNRGLTQDDILKFQEKIYGGFVEKLKKRRAKILKSADKVVAVSSFMKNLAEKIGVDSAKIKVIYNAVDFYSRPSVKDEPAVPTLVYSGRLTPWKGIGALIRVVAKLKMHYPDIIFEIIGDGSEMNNLKLKVKSLELEDNIRFRGRVSEEESHKILASSTIFVLNSNYEGFSHAILNAMAVGIPVVTTPVGGNPELVENGKSGFLVPYNDEKEWEKAVLTLLEDRSLREKFVQNAAKTFEKFKWSELLAKTAEVLKTA